MEKVLFFGDPGIDDSFAIMYGLLHPEIEIVGIVTGYGNVEHIHAAHNAAYILQLANRQDIPVISGATQLNGSNIGSYSTAVFVSPFIAASITSSNNQKWVNSGWDWMKNKRESYFSDSYNLLTMLFITGNWWKPIPDDTKIQNQINDAIYEGYDN